jgi:GST-like protein
MIELHTTPTANGFKASIMLEETGLEYRVVKYDLVRGENFKPEFLAINPVGRIPAIVDHDMPGGEPLPVYGTAAILLYLAEKTGQLLPGDLASRAKVFQWLGIVSSDIVAAYTGQFVFNLMAPERIPWALEFYEAQCIRMVSTLELQLGKTQYVTGNEYTIADVIAYPVATVSMKKHPGNLDNFPNLRRWVSLVGRRPAVQRGMSVAV